MAARQLAGVDNRGRVKSCPLGPRVHPRLSGWDPAGACSAPETPFPHPQPQTRPARGAPRPARKSQGSRGRSPRRSPPARGWAACLKPCGSRGGAPGELPAPPARARARTGRAVTMVTAAGPRPPGLSHAAARSAVHCGPGKMAASLMWW